MTHETMEKFGYPESVVKTYEHWSVLVRAAQLTAGAVVIVARSAEARRWPELEPAAFTELATVTREVEAALTAAVGFDRINYLMLMMSDPHVHFHVLPRHAAPRTICGIEIADASWPVAPDVTAKATKLTGEQIREVAALLAGHWPAD